KRRRICPPLRQRPVTDLANPIADKSARPTNLQRDIALSLGNRLLERKHDNASSETRQQDRWPIGVISNLNRQDAVRLEHVDLALELAGLCFDLGKCSRNLA